MTHIAFITNPETRNTWRAKAINNKSMALDIAKNFGGDAKDYLRMANQVLRKKINAEKNVRRHQWNL